ncbi:MAG: ribonuclease HII [Chthoniobacterales bacterium]|nr:ribonuclease HII [Chthoniobacterales bacterium]
MACDLTRERALRARGFFLVAGVDEAGRGPLAGPVVAAAVILPGDFALEGLDDSKKIPAARREKFFTLLTTQVGIAWSTGQAAVDEIDRLNILRATHLAMARAVGALPRRPDHALVDGLPVHGLPVAHTPLVGGDALSLSIAAASIIAKVTRDRLMLALDADYPQYGFAGHKGYGVPDHLEALRNHGPCPVHRRSFAPVAQASLRFEAAT